MGPQRVKKPTIIAATFFMPSPFFQIPNVSLLSSLWIPDRLLVSPRAWKEPRKYTSKLPSHQLSLVSVAAADWLATAVVWTAGSNLSHPHKGLLLHQCFPLGPTTALPTRTSQKGRLGATTTSPKHPKFLVT